MKLIISCDAITGGIPEYAIRQVSALCDAGLNVTFLCRPGFPTNRLCSCRAESILPVAPAGGSLWRRILGRISDRRKIALAVETTATMLRADAVLMTCYSEYFSPFWAGIYRRLNRQGIPIATIAHDPVRDFVLGPRWWHRWSVRQAYSFVSHVFVHDGTPVDFGGRRPARIQVHEIPHGPFEVAAPLQGRAAMRQRHGWEECDQVFLAFGQIRDGKNLDRFLKVMRNLPDTVKLLVAGSSGGGSQRPPEEYQKIAEEYGVAERCVWDIRYIPDEETGDLFAAADFVLMAYSAKFRSASGVLNAAVACRKPVLASSGDGPLKTVVTEYGLGPFVSPDNDEAILEGARRLIAEPARPEWERYEQENSWEENARRVIDACSR